jgi:hypothetical protein
MAVVKTPPSPDYGSEIDAGDEVVTPAPNARAGVTGHNVRYVLAISLAGVVVLFALLYLIFFA